MKNEQINIMLVDDHSFIMDGITARLIDVPHIKIIARAENGKDALDKLEEVSPDVILMDVEMPVMNGFEATQKILSLFPEIKVIALSTYDEKSIVLKMLSAGAGGFILKNIKKEELLNAIETVMSGMQYFSSEISFSLAKHSPEEIFQTSPKQLSVPLSEREREVLKFIIQGLSNTRIAEELFISASTVNTHRVNLMKKLDVHNLAELIRIVAQYKFI